MRDGPSPSPSSRSAPPRSPCSSRPRSSPSLFPPPLIPLPAAALGALALTPLVPGFHVATIASRFTTVIGGELVAGIPQLPPLPLLPWLTAGPGGQPLSLDYATLRALLPGA